MNNKQSLIMTLANAVINNGLTEIFVEKKVLTLKGWKYKVHAIEVYDGDVLVVRVGIHRDSEIMSALLIIKSYMNTKLKNS